MEIEKCGAEHVAIKPMPSSRKLSLMKLEAIGTDNPSVMVGVDNRVVSKLKMKVVPFISFHTISYFATFSRCIGKILKLPDCRKLQMLFAFCC